MSDGGRRAHRKDKVMTFLPWSECNPSYEVKFSKRPVEKPKL